jgi:UDP-N-acetylglucosamine 2-epimerase (non-hydrolysing)
VSIPLKTFTAPLPVEKPVANEEVISGLEGEELAVAVVTATKPDFYKQWSLIPACEKLGVPVFVINTGQHHDELLGYGLEEFDIERYIAFDLKIRGNLLQKAHELVLKAGSVGKQLREKLPDTTIVPVVHGDTLAAGVFPIGWMFSTARKVGHNEAGLRGMAPEFDKDIESFVEKQWNGEWTLAREEPFPEQWDTFVAGAGSELHFAPLELNREHLVREGYPEDRVFTVGNSVVDAMDHTKRMAPEESVFDIYPELEGQDNWIRVDVHRRANLSKARFTSLFHGVESLVREGYPVALVELPGTKFALERLKLRDKVITLAETYDNFVFTPLWKSYAHVMEFLRSGRCMAELTDSGSMQEELNELGIPALTLRYNTDRPETVSEAQSNVLVPPHKDMVGEMVRFMIDREDLLEQMGHAKKLYGENVGVKIVQKIKALHEEGLDMMRTVPQVRGIGGGSDIEFL